jgi:hypothetical protein
MINLVNNGKEEQIITLPDLKIKNHVIIDSLY